jgi:threonine synthase
MTAYDWHLECSGCAARGSTDGLPTVCPGCGAPWLVRYERRPAPTLRARLHDRPATMWRYREWLPLVEGEEPVSLGEGMTPLVRVPSIERALGLATVWIKDEAQNPTGSFKARGMSAAVTRAVAGGARRFTVPTAGNAGVALSAYGTRAGREVRVYAPRTTPPRLLESVGVYGGDLHVEDGHIGDCGRASRAWAEESGAFDVSTLREPYRIEGKKTLGLEIAEQLGWTLPDAIIYPTGGGTGLIGMWKAFLELREAGWLPETQRARLFSVQSTGCAPVVRAFEAGAPATAAWENPATVASGLRVPAPLGGALVLRGLRETGGAAVAVSDEDLVEAERRIASQEGLDMCPEGGAAVAALARLVERGIVQPQHRVIVFNTGAGWLYR